MASNIVGINIDALTDTMTAAGSAKTLVAAVNNNQVVKLDTATGSTVNLPPATGSGTKFKFIVSTLATTLNHIVQTATSSSDFMMGSLILSNANSTASVFNATATSSNTITLNRTTTGSVTLGEHIEVEDVASNLWFVRGVLSSSATPVTPFSNTAH